MVQQANRNVFKHLSGLDMNQNIIIACELRNWKSLNFYEVKFLGSSHFFPDPILGNDRATPKIVAHVEGGQK